ncbi:MAG: alanine racemase [Acidimicrobiia bacterium]|nr:alanine racemase [Acidimicrobiia bacterium]
MVRAATWEQGTGRGPARRSRKAGEGATATPSSAALCHAGRVADLDQRLTAFDLPSGLDTPCVVVDLDRLDANIARMQAAMDAAGVALRPHTKTCKSVAVARRVLEAGAQGVTVATLGEAAVLRNSSIDDIFVAYPVLATGPKAARLRHLLDQGPLTVGVDSGEGVAALVAATDPRRRPTVLVEVDCGEGRTGVAPGEAGDIARAAQDAGLTVAGVFTHGGHSYAGPDAVAGAADDEVRALDTARAALTAAGVECPVRSAGSTPTALASARPPVTEQRPGTYLYGDRHQAHLGSVAPDQHALVVAATVVSTAQPGHVVLDAGAKALAKDKAAYVAGHGVVPALGGAHLTTVHDHHGQVALPDGTTRPPVGTQVAVIPNHVCPVVNLTDEVLVVRNGAVVDRWTVDTRGRM